jgi:transposase-like protein
MRETLLIFENGSSVRKAARDFGLASTTLSRRLQAANSRHNAHAHEQKLSTAQENLLVD